MFNLQYISSVWERGCVFWTGDICTADLLYYWTSGLVIITYSCFYSLNGGHFLKKESHSKD